MSIRGYDVNIEWILPAVHFPVASSLNTVLYEWEDVVEADRISLQRWGIAGDTVPSSSVRARDALRREVNVPLSANTQALGPMIIYVAPLSSIFARPY